MKRILGAAITLAALVALAFSTAFATGFGSQLREVTLVKDGIVGTNQSDSVLFSIPLATTSTNYAYTKSVALDDLDPTTGGMANLSTTSSRVLGWVTFVQTSALWAPAADSMRVYFQTSPDGSNWSAISAVQLGTLTSGDGWAKVPILATQTGAGNNTVDGAKFIRFQFGGDTGGPWFGAARFVYYGLTENVYKPGQ